MKKISILLIVAMLLAGGALSVSAEKLDSPNYPPKATSSSTTTVKKAEEGKTTSDTLNWDQKGSFKVYTGKTYSLKATDTKGRTVTYASSDATKLTIDKAGKITPLKAGTVTISATVDKVTIVKTLTVVAGAKTTDSAPQNSTGRTDNEGITIKGDHSSPNGQTLVGGERKVVDGYTYGYDPYLGWIPSGSVEIIGIIY